MQVIPLNEGYAVCDPEIWEYLMQWNWTRKLNGNYHYPTRHRKYNEKNKRELIYMHQVVGEFFDVEVPPNHVLDHINRDGLDNRLANLRCVNMAQNALNARWRGSKSGYIGVKWDSNKALWKAYVTVDGKPKHVCYASDPTTAAMYRDKAVLKLYENAVLNFPELAEKHGAQAARLEPYTPTTEEANFLANYKRKKVRPSGLTYVKRK